MSLMRKYALCICTKNFGIVNIEPITAKDYYKLNREIQKQMTKTSGTEIIRE